MGVCCVVGCKNRTTRDPVSFYRFPTKLIWKCQKLKKLTLIRQGTWLGRIGRRVLFENPKRLKYERVCSEHFVSGRPSELHDIENPDWAPSLHLGHKSCPKRERNAAGEDLQSNKPSILLRLVNRDIQSSDPAIVKRTVCNSDVNLIKVKNCDELKISNISDCSELESSNGQLNVSYKSEIQESNFDEEHLHDSDDKDAEFLCISNYDTIQKESCDIEQCKDFDSVSSAKDQDSNVTIVYLKP